MRIALVVPHAAPPGPPSAADDGNGVTTLARTLGRLGHNVTVYARRDAPALPPAMTLAARVTVEHVPAGPPERVPAERLTPHLGEFGGYLADRWRTDPPDLAHAHFWLAGLAALAGARERGVPVVQTFDSPPGPAAQPAPPARAGPPAQSGPGRPQLREKVRVAGAQPALRLRVTLARSVRGVVARSSEEMAEVAGWGVPRALISVVPWGVDTEQFAPGGPAAWRSERPRLITVSPQDGPAGTGTVLLALAEVPDAELVVTGGPDAGRPGSGQAACHVLAGLAGELGVAGRVSFQGRVGMAELPALLRSADLLVGQDRQEPCGTVALAAMACGTPVIGPAAGCYQDAVIDGITGALVPPGQPSLLARRIRGLLASPVQLQALGVAAADRARARYSWDRIGRETVRAYRRCLAA